MELQDSITFDSDWIKNSIQLVLNKVHTNHNKLIIKESHDRWKFACPICGDSHKDTSQKRGHLFKNNLYYKCYNEDCRSTFTKLCNTYDISLDPEKKLNLINWVSNNTQLYNKSNDDILFSNFDKAISFNDLQDWFNSGLGPLKYFKPVTFPSQAYNYLKLRGFNDSHMANIYEGIKDNGKWKESYIVFLNISNNKVFGMQERNLHSGDKRKFKIWSFNELYRNIYNENLDELELISYNKVGQLFNIFNINYEKDITIFEAYLDSIFWPNSIGAVGINTDIHFLLTSELKIQFFFDYDNPGKRKAKEMLYKSQKVFLWDKFIDYWSNNNTKYSYYESIKFINENIKDLNDIIKHNMVNSYKDLLSYFSNDILDLIWITNDKFIKRKYIKQSESIHDTDWKSKINELKL